MAHPFHRIRIFPGETSFGPGVSVPDAPKWGWPDPNATSTHPAGKTRITPYRTPLLQGDTDFGVRASVPDAPTGALRISADSKNIPIDARIRICPTDTVFGLWVSVPGAPTWARRKLKIPNSVVK